MNLHRSRLFLQSYHLFPHRLFNRAVAALMRARHPKWLVRSVIRRWIERGGIDMGDFQAEDYRCVEEFFLRRLRPQARMIGEGCVCPVDGRLLSEGKIDDDATLMVKGEEISFRRLVGGYGDLDGYLGGSYVVVFLTPDGYHRIHMPEDAEILDYRWVHGRWFPQNADALRLIPKVYERNERVILRCRMHDGTDFLFVLVGASLVGGIRLQGIEMETGARGPVAVNRTFAKGEEVGRFTFGSTIVLLLPRSWNRPFVPAIDAELRMGETLWR